MYNIPEAVRTYIRGEFRGYTTSSLILSLVKKKKKKKKKEKKRKTKNTHTHTRIFFDGALHAHFSCEREAESERGTAAQVGLRKGGREERRTAGIKG